MPHLISKDSASFALFVSQSSGQEMIIFKVHVLGSLCFSISHFQMPQVHLLDISLYHILKSSNKLPPLEKSVTIDVLATYHSCLKMSSSTYANVVNNCLYHL